MGLFSSIVGFVKSVVSAIVNAVASIFQGVFGSPLVAALAIFVIAWCIAGPGAFKMLLENPLLFLTQHPILAAITMNAITTVATVINPELGRTIGYVMGIAAFIVTGLNVYNLYTNGTWGVSQAMVTYFGFVFELSEAFITAVFDFASTYSMLAFATALAAGPNSPFLQGFLDGFFVIPEIVADAADGAISAAFSGFGTLALLLLGGYLLMSRPGVIPRKDDGKRDVTIRLVTGGA